LEPIWILIEGLGHKCAHTAKIVLSITSAFINGKSLKHNTTINISV